MSMRSCAPVGNSNSRLEPALAVPNRVVITRIEGTNHCHTLSPSTVWPPREPISSGPNSARKINGWTMPKTTENGSCSTGRSSRTITIPVSRRMPRPGGREVSTWVLGLVRGAAHAASFPEVIGGVLAVVSRRLRPVRARKTSSRVGREHDD
jgi:hypothetical protein